MFTTKLFAVSDWRAESFGEHDAVDFTDHFLQH